MTTSLRDDIHQVPHQLGFLTNQSQYVNVSGVDWDFDVSGVAFLSAASEQSPYQRQLTKVQKDQIDSSENPGDNSLQNYWMRSQTDWSLGAGQEWMEPISDADVGRRYWASAGVDPFTSPGFVSALPAAEALDDPVTAGSTTVHVAKYADGFVTAAGATVRSYTLAEPPVRAGERTASSDVLGLTIAGSVALLSQAGKVSSMPVDGSAGVTDRYTGAGTAVPVTVWAKNRTLVMAGAKIWEVAGDPAQALDMSTATPIVSFADPSWVWVAGAATPTAILVAGNGDSGSSIMSITVDPQSGELPTMAAPTTVAEFPPGEQIVKIATYLGTYAIIATTSGVRVGLLNTNGGLEYGPLMGAPLLSGGGFSVWDRFAHYATADAGDGRGGMVRVDLSEIGKDSRAAWATFTRLPVAESVYGAAVLSGRSTVMVTAEQVYYCPAAGTLDAGWLETSKVRYGTLEGKNFESVKVVASPGIQGSLATATVIDGTATSIGTMTHATGYQAVYRTASRRALTQMGLRFTFTPDLAGGEVLEAWAMRALPAVEDRGQQVLLPLLNFDFERASSGVNTGYEGRAKERWEALIAVATAGTDLTIRELHSGFQYEAIVEDCSFTQVAAGNRASGFGGIISLVLRQVS